MRPAWVIALFLSFGVTLAQANAPATEPAVGRVEAKFQESDPNGGVANVLKRIGWKLPSDAPERNYDLAQESFIIYLPADYAPEKKFGLLAFISPSDNGEPPEQFLPVLDKHHLIWVAANKVGNKRPVWSRIGITLDGIHNMRSRYTLDENRIYVSGVSGGGRVASFMGVCFADVCQGGLYIIGTDFYRQLSTGRKANEFWPKAYEVPPTRILASAKKRGRHVMLNGADDQNRFQSEAIARQMKREGFSSVTYLEAPGVGHRLPGEEWLGKAISKLDESARNATTRSAPRQP